jgi:F-type H+-transporting ATPase subunit delta
MAQISKEYAEALFALACEEGKETEFLTALEEIGKIFEDQPDYAELLSSPGIPLGERLSAAEAVLDGLVPEYVSSWTQLLCEKGRIGYFSECVKEYRALLSAKNAVITAKVSSAVPLTEEEAKALKQKLEKISGQTVLLDCTVDPSLLGGVTVEMNGRVMDGSLRHRLRAVKEVMEQ